MELNNNASQNESQFTPGQETWSQPPVRVVTKTRVWPVDLASLLASLVTLWVCFLIYFVHRPASAPAPEPTQETDVWENKLAQIKDKVDLYFIGDVDEDKLADAAAAGMIEGLDDEWSYYIAAEEYASYLESVTNSYVGIGVTISPEHVDTGVEIVDVTPDSPAFEAGLRIGDVILTVEGTPVLDGSEGALDINETKNRVRGKEGTNVTITVSRDGEARDYTITRARIKTVNVTWELLEDGVAYIRIRNFEQDAAQDAIAAIEAARAQNAKSILFDVRFNPGGYKHELVKLLDYLLPEGPLFRSVDYSGKESVDSSDADFLDMPMAVLVNYDSYSAAEFFAAALQEYEAAAVVGVQTYGKGRFQTAISLQDGSAINISVGQYTTPKGISLVGKGITPDHVVELTEEKQMDLYYGRLQKEEDDQLQEAIAVLTNE